MEKLEEEMWDAKEKAATAESKCKDLASKNKVRNKQHIKRGNYLKTKHHLIGVLQLCPFCFLS